MKRFLIVFFIVLILPINIYAQDDYYNQLSNYDLSVFKDNVDNDTYKLLESLGITDFDYNSIESLSLNDILRIIKSVIDGKIKSPISSCCEIMILVILSSLVKSLKSNDDSYNEMYSTITGLTIAILLFAKIGDTISISTMAISTASNFMYGFVPVFCGIVAASGNIGASLSTNTLLLLLAQGLNFISSNVFMPIINCFLALSVCSSLRYELHLSRLIYSTRKIITSCISFLSAAFVSILSIKTAVASKADAIGLRSIRFAINSVVPVIGSAISEGLLSIQSYSSLIKSSVGVVGIIAVALMFLPSILGVSIWRLCLNVCNIVSDTFDDKTVSMVLQSFINTMLLINVILILSMVTTIISIGILIAAGG